MRINFWYISSLLISLFVIIPIMTVFTSFFDNTSNYYQILKDTFLLEYIFNSIILLFSVLILTFLIGTGSAYLQKNSKHLTRSLMSLPTNWKWLSTTNTILNLLLRRLQRWIPIVNYWCNPNGVLEKK